MRELPMGTVTLLFSDIEGSTHPLEQVGERYASVLRECRDLLRAIFRTHHGHEVDTQGDAFFVAFARASDAISVAANAQRVQRALIQSQHLAGPGSQIALFQPHQLLTQASR